jgi:hypothetical protein
MGKLKKEQKRTAKYNEIQAKTDTWENNDELNENIFDIFASRND